MITDQTEPRYCDYYAFLSYKDFLSHAAAGTLSGYAISARTDQDVTA